jgi:hypothetical protein
MFRLIFFYAFLLGFGCAEVANAFTVPAGQLKLAWDPNPESDIAGYKIHLGVESGIYPHRIDVGSSTVILLPDLKPGTYYCAVSAYNQFGAESELSEEVAVTVDSAPPADAEPSLVLEGPRDVWATVGSSISLSMRLSTTEEVSIQWQKDGAPVHGARSASLVIGPLEPYSTGSYTALITTSDEVLVAGPAMVNLSDSETQISGLQVGKGSIELKFAVKSSGSPVQVLASDDLKVWQSLGTGAVQNGVIKINDPASMTRPRRFYRAIGVQ